MKDKIGLAAGEVWKYLNKHGESSISKMAKDLRQTENVVHMGLGWLAKENKVTIKQHDDMTIKAKLA